MMQTFLFNNCSRRIHIQRFQFQYSNTNFNFFVFLINLRNVIICKIVLWKFFSYGRFYRFSDIVFPDTSEHFTGQPSPFNNDLSLCIRTIWKPPIFLRHTHTHTDLGLRPYNLDIWRNTTCHLCEIETNRVVIIFF